MGRVAIESPDLPPPGCRGRAVKLRNLGRERGSFSCLCAEG